MDSSKKKDFKELLDNQYDWPADYLFKFIVTKEFKDELLVIIGGHKAIEKPSSKGKYISVSLRIMMHNAEEVMEVYNKASNVKSVMPL